VVTNQEKEIVKTLLWFVNLEPIESTELIELTCEKAIGYSFENYLEKSEVKIYENEQKRIRKWLNKLIKNPMLKSQYGEVNSVLARKTVIATPYLHSGKLHHEYHATGTEGFTMLAIAKIIENKLGKYIFECRNSECNIFNIYAWKPVKGRPREFCNSKCKDRYHSIQKAYKYKN